jgi:hypothetical protein
MPDLPKKDFKYFVSDTWKDADLLEE